MIGRVPLFCLGLGQLISWGLFYYLIGGFGERIAADLGWSLARVHGGFSVALVVMGLTSPTVGRLIERHGGRPVLAAGMVAGAAGCTVLALAHGVAGYYAAWLLLGVAMRCSLYDAAFAALARAGGPAARGPMAQITLLGGLASTVFWPLGDALAAAFGWRGAMLVYAAIALAAIPLHLALPRGRYQAGAGTAAGATGFASPVRDARLAALLYALIITLTGFLAAAMSAHMITVLVALGLATPVAVGIGALRGVGQSLARLAEILSGGRLSPPTLNLLAVALLPASFAAAFAGGQWIAAALAFAFLYGAGNGLLTITRGTLPLVLFDPSTYGSLVGRLLAPGFIVSAAAPLVYALVIENWGVAAALWLCVLLAVVMLAAAAVLKLHCTPQR